MRERLADVVKRLRKSRGLTQQELGQLAGVGRETIYRIEKGKSEHGHSTVESVLHALGANAEELSIANTSKPPTHTLTKAASEFAQLFEQLSGHDQSILRGLVESLLSGRSLPAPPEPPPPAVTESAPAPVLGLPRKGRRKP